MNGEGAETPRPRPLSGGLWTLLSWLRRDESSSSESLSSVGSDRSAASFAFLAPPAPRARTPAAPQPPASPSSDTYRKRVRDRNLRRQYDRDLTLHRKYGLFRCDGGYDAFSLPPARRGIEPGGREERDRRASSECCQRRAAHVPGKRRAPAPPASPASPATLPARRHSRKRPAPQPPVKLAGNTKEAIETLHRSKTDIVLQMNSKSDRDRRPLSSTDTFMDCKSEKYSKKEKNTKDKSRTEKSFLKQIFENRKRNSAVETTPIKILPNISELDKQAAEIIASCKLRALEKNNNSTNNSMLPRGDSWFCTRCLRKYDSNVTACLYCLPNQKYLANDLLKGNANVANKGSNICTQTQKESSNVVASTSRISGIGLEEKQKLKEMLKEMKDSLPKRPKHEKNHIINYESKNNATLKSSEENIVAIETPTLRIGSTFLDDIKITPVSRLSSSEQSSNNSEIKSIGISEHTFSSVSLPSTDKQTDETTDNKTVEVINKTTTSNNLKINPVSESYIITQHVVLMAPQRKDYNQRSSNKYSSEINAVANKVFSNINSSKVTEFKTDENKEMTKEPFHAAGSEKANLHIPLKISSLLNPVYIPKNVICAEQSPRTQFFSQVETKSPQTRLAIKPITTVKTSNAPASNLVLGSTSVPQPYRSTPQATTTTEAKLKENGKRQPTEKYQSSSKEHTTTQVVHNVESPILKPSLQPEKKLPIKMSTASNTSSPHERLSNSNMIKFTVEQHSRRRDLVNQLEQSIAQGDERAAAEAASKLAQLRLACSVLSFSSQIAGATSKLTPNAELQKVAESNKTHNTPTGHASSKVNVAVQSMVSLLPKNENNNQTSVNKEDKPISTRSEAKVTTKLLSNEETSQRPVPPITDLSPSTSRGGGPRTSNENANLISINVWVEDREATRGPVHLRVSRSAAVGELRRQAEASLGLAARLQRWIVGRALCTDDSVPLASLAGPDLTAPFYLCLVESETKTETAPRVKCQIATISEAQPNDKAGDVYSELMQLEKRALVPNAEPFECGVCMETCIADGGAVLRECVHSFCRDCLSDLVRYCEEPAVACPAMGCPGTLQEREIRALVAPEEYERWLARGLAAAESGTRNAFHCRTRDCTGWALCEPGVRRFPCPVCKQTNCVPCEAIHEGTTCEQHSAKLQEAAASRDASETDQGTRVLLDSLITKGEALQCPECSAIITKKWGCDWVKCSACKTEICWATRGRRWGPAGRGDTSGGCRCGVDGQRCHPSCGYCH